MEAVAMTLRFKANEVFVLTKCSIMPPQIVVKHPSASGLKVERKAITLKSQYFQSFKVRHLELDLIFNCLKEIRYHFKNFVTSLLAALLTTREVRGSLLQYLLALYLSLTRIKSCKIAWSLPIFMCKICRPCNQIKQSSVKQMFNLYFRLVR